MKTPPKGPEFERFTDAMRQIMKVSKTEIQRRMEEGKRPKPSASHVPAVSPKHPA